MTEAEQAIHRWNYHAQHLMGNFTAQGDLSRIVLLNPVLFDLLGEVVGKKILDAGCGEGYLSRLLAQQGANMTAVDFSTQMLEMSRMRTPADLPITYHHGNCEALSFLDSAQFDIVVSNMVIQDLPNYQAAIAEAYRLVKPGGTYVFSILHPCFCTSMGGWERGANRRKLYWKVDQYFAEVRFEQQDYPRGATEPIFAYHRTLSNYVTTLLKTGFVLEALIEPQPHPEQLQLYPEFADGFRISFFLVFKLRRPLQD